MALSRKRRYIVARVKPTVQGRKQISMQRLHIRPSAKAAVPGYVEAWFAGRGWEPRPYQRKMIDAFARRQSTLLVAPTGGGKTLSGFLPSLIDIHETRPKGLHTLYISPLKALEIPILAIIGLPCISL